LKGRKTSTSSPTITPFTHSGFLRDGIQLLKEIKSRWKDLPFILFTGKGREEVVIEALNNGADFYVKKGGDVKTQFTELSHLIRCVYEKKMVERAMAENEKLFATAFMINPVPMTITAEETGCFIMVNDSFLSFSGFTREEVIGKTTVELGIWRNPEERAEFLQMLIENGSIRDVSFVHRIKGGAERVVQASAERIEYRGEGCILFTFRDITVQLDLERRLMESEKLYRAIFENTGTAMAIIEEDTTLSMVNGRFVEIAGYSREEIEGRMSWKDFVVAEDIPRMLEYHRLRRQSPDRVPRNYSFNFRDKENNIHQGLLTIDLLPGIRKSIASIIDLSSLNE